MIFRSPFQPQPLCDFVIPLLKMLEFVIPLISLLDASFGPCSVLARLRFRLASLRKGTNLRKTTHPQTLTGQKQVNSNVYRFKKKMVQVISTLSKMTKSALVRSGIRAHVLQSGPQWPTGGQTEILFFHAMTVLWVSATSTDVLVSWYRWMYLEYSYIEHR